jgi:hypothetical protein
MNTKSNNMSAHVILAASAMIILASVCATHGQDTVEKNDDVLITPVAYTSEQLRDPFEGYVLDEAIPVDNVIYEEEAVVLPALAIAGITWGSSYPQAIINDKVVKAGDMVGDVQVVSIAKEGLIFLYKKKQFIVPAPGAGGAQKSNKKSGKDER